MTKLLVLLLIATPSRAEEAPVVGLQVTGEASCPTVDQIHQSLAHLHPDANARGWKLELTGAEPTTDLGVRFFDPSNALVGERRFAGLPDCGLRADAVAATLAVWLGELTPQPLPSAPGSEAPEPAAAPTPRPVAIVSAAPSQPKHPRWQLELGAAALGSLDQTGAAAGGVRLSSWVRPLAQWWGLQAHLSWEAPRSLALGTGFADWQRVTLAAGAHFPLQPGRIGFELEADLLAGLTVSQGRDLSVSRLDAALDPGLFAGARFFADPLPTWRGWLSVGVAAWPVRQQVGLFSGTSPAALATLPQLEFLLALGGSWLD
jgi:hypothetical protein